MSVLDGDDQLVTVGEAARLWGVTGKTVIRWCEDPRNGLTVTRTPGGHRRLRLSQVMELRDGSETSRLP